MKKNGSEIQKILKETMSRTTPVISVFDECAISMATKLIKSGKVIALPTDTVYGLAVSVQDNNGIRSLYKIKKRNNSKPVAICVGEVSDIHLWGETSHLPNSILESLLPGAVTIVLQRKSYLNPLLNPGTKLIGIRVPKFSFVQKLAKTNGAPLALTSANISSESSPLNINEFNHLWHYLGAVFNGGDLSKTSSRVGSTVIDLSEPGYFKIIREGSALNSTIQTVKNFKLLEKYKQ